MLLACLHKRKNCTCYSSIHLPFSHKVKRDFLHAYFTFFSDEDGCVYTGGIIIVTIRVKRAT